MENEVNNVRQESVTRSLRITNDRAEEYDRVKEVFSNGNEFADWIVSVYKLYESKQIDDLFSKDTAAILNMFESISSRISNIIKMANETVSNKDAAIEIELRAKDDRIDNLKERIEELQEIINEKDEEIKVQKDEYKALQFQLKEQMENYAELEKSYTEVKNVNDVLVLQKDHYEKVEQENKELIEQVDTLHSLLSDTQTKLNESNQKVIELERDKEILQERYNDKINAIEVAHKQAIIHLESMKDNEVSKARLDAQEQAQTKIQAHMDKEQELRDKIDILKEEHEKEVSELNRELNEVKAALEESKKKPKTKSKAKAKEQEEGTE